MGEMKELIQKYCEGIRFEVYHNQIFTEVGILYFAHYFSLQAQKMFEKQIEVISHYISDKIQTL